MTPSASRRARAEQYVREAMKYEMVDDLEQFAAAEVARVLDELEEGLVEHRGKDTLLVIYKLIEQAREAGR